MTGYTAIPELQTGVYDALTGDDPLMALITGVYDEVPAGTAEPYISFGGHIEGPWPTAGKWNSTMQLFLDVWSSQPGDEECYAILSEMNRILNNHPISLTNYTNCQLSYDWSTLVREPPEGKRHLSVRYQAVAVNT